MEQEIRNKIHVVVKIKFELLTRSISWPEFYETL